MIHFTDAFVLGFGVVLGGGCAVGLLSLALAAVEAAGDYMRDRWRSEKQS